MFYQVRATPSHYAKFSKSSADLTSKRTIRTSHSSGFITVRHQLERTFREITYQHSRNTSIRHPRRKRRPRLRSGVIANREEVYQSKQNNSSSRSQSRGNPQPPTERESSQQHAAEESGLAGGTRGRGVRQARQAAIRCAPVGLPAYQPTTPPHLPARLNLRRILQLLIYQQLKDQAEREGQDLKTIQQQP